MLKCARMIKYEEELEKLQSWQDHVDRRKAGATREEIQALEEHSQTVKQAVQKRIPGLTDQDLQILRDEGKWSHQPWTLYLTVVLNSVAAAIQVPDEELSPEFEAFVSSRSCTTTCGSDLDILGMGSDWNQWGESAVAGTLQNSG